jgi:hypothetical protein
MLIEPEPTRKMVEAGVDALLDAEDLRSPFGRERAIAAIWRAMRAAEPHHSSGSGDRPGEK